MADNRKFRPGSVPIYGPIEARTEKGIAAYTDGVFHEKDENVESLYDIIESVRNKLIELEEKNSNETFVGTMEEYKTASIAGLIALDTIVYILDDDYTEEDEPDVPDVPDIPVEPEDDKTLGILGVGVLGYMVLGKESSNNQTTLGNQ